MEEYHECDLFNVPTYQEEHSDILPEYNNEKIKPWQTIYLHVRNRSDRDELAKLLNQKLTDKTKYVWHPKNEINRTCNKIWFSIPPMNPVYPIYIVSKGRWESRLTVKALDKMNVPYRIVIEPQELDEYNRVIDESKILVLPFSNLGQGSIPARNWIWEHSISEGHSHHWILDDNIRSFQRYHNNEKIRVGDGSIFWNAEQMVNQYSNVGLSGFNYTAFCQAKLRGDKPIFYLNTRIYSCILINNSIPHRWRGKYNEDTDLSLRVLKGGLCTIQFHCFLSEKMKTMTMKGGNTDELYKGDGRLKFAESLRDQHPDLCRVSFKNGHYQHHVDYSGFKQKLIFKNPKPKVVKLDWIMKQVDD